MQACKYASMQVCKYTSMQVCKYASMQICKYAFMQAGKHTNRQQQQVIAKLSKKSYVKAVPTKNNFMQDMP